MEKLKVPSLQHLARNWHPTAEKVSKELIGLVQNPPTFSYTILYDLIRDLVVLHQPLHDVMEGVRRKVTRADIRDNFLEILPLIGRYFDESMPTFVQAVNGRMYPLARELMIPFTPPLVYGANGKLIFPWFSFWKRKPLEGERLSLFVTVVDEILKQDADLDSAIFQILDFSAPAGSKSRGLVVTDSHEIPRLTRGRKEEMLAVFSEGLHIAKSCLAGTIAKDREQCARHPDDHQQADLFDFDI
jgi:hypothetical protein